MTKHKILVVDDDSDILELLEYNLKNEGYEVRAANDGFQAIEVLKNFQAELILLDVMMPNLDGIETCRRIREGNNIHPPHIIFLTARTEEFTEVAAWEAGGNDFIIKPIKMRALKKRISVILEKGNGNKNSNILEISGVKIDRANYTVTIEDEVFSLPKKEFEILFFLASHPNIIQNRDDILSNVWEDDTYVLSRTVDVHIRKLREKLSKNCIKTIKGVGYMFEVS